MGLLEREIEVGPHIEKKFVPTLLEAFEFGPVLIAHSFALGPNQFGLIFFTREGGPACGQFAEHFFELAIVAFKQRVGPL